MDDRSASEPEVIADDEGLPTEVAPMRVDGRRLRRRASRAKVLQASLTLFADQGYYITTLEQIAVLAGVSKGTIFNNFTSKAVLYAETVEWVAQRVRDNIETALVGVPEGFESFSVVIENLVALFDDEPTMTRLLLRELTRPPFALDLPPTSMRDALIVPMADMLNGVHEASADRAQGQWDHDTLPTLAAALSGGIAVAALDRQVHHGELPPEKVSRALITAFRGLRPEGLELGA